ncbi:MAG TPA: dihydropteroate synthase [Acidobacteriota bacterium]|nr:dihydropteroate synthase [Acidobacteriota bacterium]
MQRENITRREEYTDAIGLAGGRELPLSRPLVMGVLNVTPDSFSDGGRYLRKEVAVRHALEMVGQGADIIDVGGESTRPGADPVGDEQEQARIVPVIEALRRQSPVAISVDSYHASTARAAIRAGADIVNDVSALRFDPAMAAVVAAEGVPVILMHMLGTPRDMQKDPVYVDCVREIDAFFEERIEHCRRSGIDAARLILDPGIGFGKRLSDNVDILRHLGRFKRHGLPLAVGTSRKSFLGMLHPAGSEPDQRLGGSVASALAAVAHGADIVRVHDVGQTVVALKVVQAIGDNR